MNGCEARFRFGENWKAYASLIDESRIARARASMQRLLGRESLVGCRFLDIGSGSGLSSLIAREMGATVMSFDYDVGSVECTKNLKARYRAEDNLWRIAHGDILDDDCVSSLQAYDIVYSWGVLHHTGNMWQAVNNAAALVCESGTLVIALYNDQGWRSRVWRTVKRTYVVSPSFVKGVLLAICLLRLWGPTTVRDIVKRRPFNSWRHYSRERGMSPWFDVIDWVGGYPFEVATPDAVKGHMGKRGFSLVREFPVGRGSGCNEFVFRRD